MTLVEQYVRVRAVSDTAAEPPALPVVLRYDPAVDATRVAVALPGPGVGRQRVFGRALLEEGLRTPAEADGVRIWPCGRAQTVVELHAVEGGVVLQFDSTDLTRFLRRTYTAAAHYEASLTGPATRVAQPHVSG